MRQLFAHRVPPVTVVSDMSDAMRFFSFLTVLASMTALCSAFLLPKSREDEDKGGKNFCITMLPTAREVMFSQASICPKSASWLLGHC